MIVAELNPFFPQVNLIYFYKAHFPSNKTLLTVFTIPKSHVSGVRNIQSSPTAGCKRRILI